MNIKNNNILNKLQKKIISFKFLRIFLKKYTNFTLYLKQDFSLYLKMFLKFNNKKI